MKGYFITGTDTGVGKTIITAALAKILANRFRVGVFKPVQTGVPDPANSDARYLYDASGMISPLEDTYAYSFPDPVAPIVAAANAGIPISIEHIKKKFREVQNRSDIVLVEGAGGLMVPLAEDLLISDIVHEFSLPLCIVARPDLGTINHTLLTIHTARSLKLPVAGVIINGYREDPDGPDIRDTVELIEKFGTVKVFGVIPWFNDGNEVTIINLVSGWLADWIPEHGTSRA